MLADSDRTVPFLATRPAVAIRAPLRPALDADVEHIDQRSGPLALYRRVPRDSAHPPLLLIHTVNASASAQEIRPLFEHYGSRRPTYALDLPGYGLSERSDRAYTPRLMTDALYDAVDAIARHHGPVPVDAVAVSLSCEFLARAAVEEPARFRTISLVSPTGLQGGSKLYGPPGASREIGWVRALIAGRPWSRALFRGLTRPGVIRYFLARTWGRPEIDEALWQYDLETTAEPGAEYAPLSFLSGGLFSRDVNALYEALSLPVWASHGIRGDFTDYRGKARLEGRPNWSFTVFSTGALPYFEVLDEFTARLDAHLGTS